MTRMIATLLSGIVTVGSVGTTAFVVTSCDPAVIAPLPSPVRPDEDRITTSSLGLTTDTSTDSLVAVVGLPGAVSEAGDVRVTNERTGVENVFLATEVGTFSATVYGRAGDELTLVYIDADSRESEPLELTINEYPDEKDEPTNGGVTGEPASPPMVPGSGFEFGDSDGGGQCTEPDCETPEPNAPDDRLAVIWSFDGTELHVEGGEGFTTPNANVVVSNHSTGMVAVVNATDKGAARIDIPASVGDQIIMFAQSSIDASLTSPAITFTVPKAGQSAGTETPATP